MSIENLYNVVAVVETPTPAQTPTGSWNDTWAVTEAALRCRFQPTSGNETILDDKETVTITHKMFCASNANISNKDRVTVGSIVARVHTIRDIDILGHHLEIGLSDKT